MQHSIGITVPSLSHTRALRACAYFTLYTCLTCITYLAAITHSNQKEIIITMNIMIVIRKDMMMIMKRAVIITLKPDSNDGKVFKDYFFIVIILIMVFIKSS